MRSADFEYIGLLPKDDRTPQVLISEISSFWRKEVTVPERLFCIFCLNPVTWSTHTISGFGICMAAGVVTLVGKYMSD